MKKESEKKIETKLKEAMERIGGKCYKMWAYNNMGIPDRLCCFPGGIAVFVETKTTGDKPRKIQKLVHSQLKEIGFEVRIVDTSDKIKKLIEDYA